MGKRTPLFELHQADGARIIDFGGWDMPVDYGSQIEEHHAVRRDAGMFDVSHMCAVDLRGAGARPLLLRLLANDVSRLTAPGKALYSCMLRPDGGVIDDLIAYYLDEKWFRLVVNAGTADKDLAWIKEHAKQIGVAVVARRDLAMVAVQGPMARDKAAASLPAECRAPAAALGARDTLRLEAGMNLYGNDMDESVSPLESGLAWTVVLEGTRDFIGKAALEAQRAAGLKRKLVGLLLLERGVLRSHQKVFAGGAGEGEMTSGTFSPTLERSIGFARVPAGAPAQVEVDIRGKRLPARIVKPPFVRNGRALIEL
jgi:aminomethyltransferase